jgi:hypothetical protein
MVAAQILACGAVMYANTGQPAEIGSLCAGLAAAAARTSGLAKLILQVIAGFFGCS